MQGGEDITELHTSWQIPSYEKFSGNCSKDSHFTELNNITSKVIKELYYAYAQNNQNFAV